MADKSKKDATAPPLLLMPPGGGLTLNPPDQPNFLMPVVQPEQSFLDEDCEADSFVGQGPTAGAAPLLGGPPMPMGGPGTSGGVTFFQGTPSSGASDPFAQVGQFPSSQPPPASIFNPSQVSSPQGPPQGPPAGHLSSPPGHPPVSGQSPAGGPPLPVSASAAGGATPPSWAPPSTDKGATNIYRQKGPKLRYAQPPAGTYASNNPSSGQQMDTSAPPMFNTPPPVQPSFASPSFMTPASTSGPPPMGMSPPVAPPSQTPAAASFSQVPPSQGMMVPGVGMYQAVRHHWCYRKTVEGRDIWYTFSRLDSGKLEEQFQKEISGGASEVISTDGGRFDVEIRARLRRAVYWEEEPAIIQRCSWFYKRESDNRYVPYEEGQAERLEAEYKSAIERNDWHKRIELPGKDTIVMHNPNVIVHFKASSQPDEWGNVQTDQMRPSVVKRGVEDFGTIEDGESAEVDHLVFVLHGIGDMCDVRFRNIVECVDDFRSIANGLIKTHFGPYAQNGHIHRVEFLPVHWHMAVHSEATGVDSRLKSITLPSTRKLRDFVNDTLMDILFYTSPAYCQIICDTVGQEMNRLFQIFLTRNATFNGEVSLAGHSLGASILFDLLMHQHGPGEGLGVNGFNNTADSLDDTDTSQDNTATETEPELEEPEEEEAPQPEVTLESLLEKVGLKDKADVFHNEQIDLESLSMCSEQDLKDLGLPMGPRKKLLLLVQEEKGKKEQKSLQDLEKKIRKQLEKKLKLEAKEAAKQEAPVQQKPQSSISVDFICGLAGTGQPFVRYPQLEFSPSSLFALGSPIGVFLSARGVQQMGENFRLPTCPRFFNIFHPAYRLEPLINSSTSTTKPVLVPHYKGRKRMHLELKESISRMGTDLKHKIVESLRSTWNSLHDFARAHRSDGTAASEGQDGSQGLEKEVDQQVNSVMAEMVQQQDMDKSDTASVCSSHDDEVPVGQLNEGRRIDYVLQEKPIESFNDYLFALASHGCYWTSEDTALLILKEIYMPLGISPLMPLPDGTMPKPVMPTTMAPPPKSAVPYPGASQPAATLPPQYGAATSPSGPPLHPPPIGAGIQLPPHMQGPVNPLSSPFLPSGPGSQGSSRGATPPLGPQRMPPASVMGPPPAAGFVRSSPMQ